jgi:hypothetical protein
MTLAFAIVLLIGFVLGWIAAALNDPGWPPR